MDWFRVIDLNDFLSKTSAGSQVNPLASSGDSGTGGRF
jgi:hypothetical protein